MACSSDSSGNYYNWEGANCGGRQYPVVTGDFINSQDPPNGNLSFFYRLPEGEVTGGCWSQGDCPDSHVASSEECRSQYGSDFSSGTYVKYRCSGQGTDGNGFCCDCAKSCLRTQWPNDQDQKLNCCLGTAHDPITCAPDWSVQNLTQGTCDDVMIPYCGNSNNVTSTPCQQWCGASPQNRNRCDQAMINYCSQSAHSTEDICACINSQIGLAPQCFDSNCIGKGYKTSTMLTSCNQTVCNEVVNCINQGTSNQCNIGDPGNPNAIQFCNICGDQAGKLSGPNPCETHPPAPPIPGPDNTRVIIEIIIFVVLIIIIIGVVIILVTRAQARAKPNLSAPQSGLARPASSAD